MGFQCILDLKLILFCLYIEKVRRTKLRVQVNFQVDFSIFAWLLLSCFSSLFMFCSTSNISSCIRLAIKCFASVFY